MDYDDTFHINYSTDDLMGYLGIPLVNISPRIKIREYEIIFLFSFIHCKKVDEKIHKGLSKWRKRDTLQCLPESISIVMVFEWRTYYEAHVLQNWETFMRNISNLVNLQHVKRVRISFDAKKVPPIIMKRKHNKWREFFNGVNTMVDYPFMVLEKGLIGWDEWTFPRSLYDLDEEDDEDDEDEDDEDDEDEDDEDEDEDEVMYEGEGEEDDDDDDDEEEDIYEEEDDDEDMY